MSELVPVEVTTTLAGALSKTVAVLTAVLALSGEFSYDVPSPIAVTVTPYVTPGLRPVMNPPLEKFIKSPMKTPALVYSDTVYDTAFGTPVNETEIELELAPPAVILDGVCSGTFGVETTCVAVSLELV